MGIARLMLLRADRLLSPELCPGCGMEVTAGHGRLCASCSLSASPFPDDGRCSMCGGESGSVTGLCRECSARLRPWFRGVSAFPYSGGGGDLLRRYKYSGQTFLAPFFASAMAAAWRRHGPPARPEIIVPIPLHWMRLCRRGFNQAALLASFLGKELKIPVVDALKRHRSTGHQARLDAEQRLENLQHAFELRKAVRVTGKRILLLDDVFTTGATLSAASAVLSAAGAVEISVITAARA